MSSHALRVSVATMIVVVGLVLPAAAQEQTGSIEGVVRDQQGGLLSAVGVVARNLAVDTTVDVLTDERGTFRFAALGPGFYDVTASRAGFQPSRFDRVEVLLGQIKRLEFTLVVAGIAETVQVSPGSPLVDVKQSARGFSLRQDQLEYLPRGIDYTSVVRLLPGTNIEPKLGGISVDGASAAENRFIVDGIDTSNVVSGLSAQGLNVDDVEELQVKSSGYSAEYGGATGGVVNVLTRSGTNAWHGDVRFYAGGDWFDATARRNLRRKLTVVNEAEYFTYDEDPYTRLQPGFSASGPVRRNLAWFFVAYQPVLARTERTVTFALDGSTATLDQDVTTHLLTAAQTVQLGPRLRTRASFNASPTSTDGLLPAQAGTDSPDSTFDLRLREPNWTLSGTADFLASASVFVSGRVGYTLKDLHTEGAGSQPRFSFPVTNIGLLDVPPALQRVTGYLTDSNTSVTVRDRLSRLSTQLDATWYVRAWGEHALKAGVQADWSANDVDRGFITNPVGLNWNRPLGGVRGTYGYYTVGSNTLEPKRGGILLGKGQGRSAGLFVQDAWRIGRKLTVNAGLRTEQEKVPKFGKDGSHGETIIDFSFGEKIAPRLGVAYDVRGDGRWKLYGSWGVFYDVFKYSLPQGFGGSIYNITYAFTLDTYDWPNLLNSPDCPPACPGTLIRRTQTIAAEAPIDPGLEPTRSQEVVGGVEHQWTPHLLLTARYVHKQLDRAVDDIGALDATLQEIYTIGNPGYGLAEFAYPGVPLPKAVRDYDAVEVGARRPLFRGWGFALSYLWSRLYGNYSGLSQSDENGRVSPNIGRVYDNPFVMLDEKARPVYGPLATDRPHQLKGMFVYQAPFRLTVGAYQFLASGLPVTREVRVVPLSAFPLMYKGRLSDGRTPALSQTDLYVQQEIAVWRRTRVSVGISVTNLFDQDTAISKYIVENEFGFPLSLTPADFFGGRFDVRQAMEQQHINTDARFLLPEAFQAPRTARVMLKWSF